MILDIIEYPAYELYKVSEEVIHFNDDLNTLLDNMYSTMSHHLALGLSAVQVGRPIRVALIANPNTGKVIEAINPVITAYAGTQYKPETA